MSLLLDARRYAEGKLEGFVGREWLVEDVKNWQANPKGKRILLLVGETGIGKSAIAAHLWLDQSLVDAVHFCIGGQGGTVEPLNFIRLVAEQLAAVNPTFARALKDVQEMHADQSIVIHNLIQIGSVLPGSQVTGVQISLRMVSAETAFDRLLRQPLRRTAELGVLPSLTILVDALDESLTYSGHPGILDLLMQVDDLPSSVRFVLTSRPESRVQDAFLPLHPLILDANSSQNRQDIEEYLHRAWQSDERICLAVQTWGWDEAAFVKEMASKAEWNFLYLTEVLPLIAEGNVISPEALPIGLEDYYTYLFRTRFTPNEWMEWGAPLLEIVFAFQEPATFDQLVTILAWDRRPLNQRLHLLAPLFDPTLSNEDRYWPHHWSVVEYLSDRKKAGMYWCDLDAGHQRIIDYYLENPENWHHHNAYPLRYLNIHLAHVGMFHQLGTLIENRAWYEAQWLEDPTLFNYVEDIGRGIELAGSRGIDGLPSTVAWSLLLATLRSRATEIPVEALEIMVQIGQDGWAQHYAELMTSPIAQSKAYCHIAKSYIFLNKLDEAKVLYPLALSIANTIEDNLAQFEAYLDMVLIYINVVTKDEIMGLLETMLNAVDNDKISRHFRDKSELLLLKSTIPWFFVELEEKEQARVLLRQILTEFKDIIEQEKYLDEDFLFHMAIPAGELTKLGEFRLPLDVMDRLHERPPQLEMLEWIARAFTSNGDSNQLENLLRIALRFSDKEACKQAVATIAVGMSHLENIDRFIEIVSGECHRDVQVEVLVHAAWTIIHDEDIKGERKRTATTLLLQAALAGLDHLSGDEFVSVRSYIAIMYAQLEEKEACIAPAQQVIDNLEIVEDETHKLRMLSSLAYALAQIDEKNWARELLYGIKDKLDDFIRKTEKMNWGVTNAPPGELHDPLDKASNGFEEYEWDEISFSFTPGIAIFANTLGDIANLTVLSLAIVNEHELALSTTKSIPSKKTLNNVLLSLIDFYARSNNFDKSLIILNNFEYSFMPRKSVEEYQSEAIDKIIQRATKYNNRNRLSKLAEFVDKFHSGQSQSKALIALARAWSEMKDYEEAGKLLNKVILAQLNDTAQSLIDILGKEASKKIAQTMIKTGNLDAALVIAKELLIKEREHSNYSSSDLAEVALAFARIGDFRNAKLITESLIDKHASAKVAIEIATTFLKNYDTEHAVEMLDYALSTIGNISREEERAKVLEAFVSAITLLEKHEYTNKMLRIVKDIETDQWRAYALKAMMPEVNNLDELEVSVMIARGVEVTSYSLFVLQQAIAMAFSQVHTNDYQRMIALSLQLTDDRAQLTALEKIVKQLSKAGDFKQALELIDEMKEYSVSDYESEKAMKHVIAALAESGELEHALELANHDPQMLNHLTLTVARNGRIIWGIRLIDQIDDPYWNTKTKVDMADFLFQIHQPKRAGDLLKQALNASKTLIIENTSYFSSYENVGEEFVRASRLLCEIDEKDYVRSIVNEILSDFEFDTNDYWIPYAISPLAPAATCARNYDSYLTMFEIAKIIEDGDGRLQTFVTIAQAISETQYPDYTDKIVRLETILSEAIKVEKNCSKGLFGKNRCLQILEITIMAMAEAESIDGLHRVLEMVRNISEDWKQKALIAISKALTLVKDRQGLKLVAEMIDHIYPRYEQDGIKAELAGTWAQLNDLESAFDILSDGVSSYGHSAGLRNITKVLEENGKTNELQNVLKKIKPDRVYVGVLISVAEAYAKVGRLQETRDVLGRALAIALDVGDDIWRYEDKFFIPTAKPVVHRMQMDNCEEKWNEELRSSESSLLYSEGYMKKDEFLSDTIRLMVKVGCVDLALSKIKTIQDDYYFSSAMSEIVEVFAHTNEFDKALNLANEIRDRSTYAKALMEIVNAMIVAGESKQAREILPQVLEIMTSGSYRSYRPNPLEDLTPALMFVTSDENDDQMVRWLYQAFRKGYIHGQSEVQNYISAFAPVLGKLGVIAQTWEHLQAVEKVLTGQAA